MNCIRNFIIINCILFSGSIVADTVFQQNGVAIKGYDPVSYHTMKQAVAGKAQFAFEWKGVKWLFSSQENKNLFSSNPDNYAPKYGGYCAYAASKGALAPIDPDAWTIHANKLYLNYSLSVRKIWRQDIEGNIKKANTNWPKLNK